MAIFLIILMFLTICHFIYNGIILPSIRIHLRNKLFILRDELRNIKLIKRQNCDDKAFKLIHDGINTYLNRLPLLTMDLKVSFEEEYKKNISLQKEIQHRRSIIENCGDENLKAIFYKANEVLGYAFIANLGGWFIYLIPVCILLVSISKLSELIKELIVIPSKEANYLMPVSKAASNHFLNAC